MELAVKSSSSACKKYCCVPQCPSKVTRERSLSFHRFPKTGRKITLNDDHGQKEQHELKDLWARQLQITKPVTSCMIVCSRHFSRGDFILPDSPARKRFCLKRSAIPSQNLPIKSSKTNVIYGTYNSKAKESSLKCQGTGPQLNFQPVKEQETFFECVNVPEQNSVQQQMSPETSDPSEETVTNFENLKVHIKEENEGEVNSYIENVNPFTTKQSMCFFPVDLTSIKTEPIEEVNVDELCNLDKDVNESTLQKEEDPINSHDSYFVNGTFIKLEKPETEFDARNLKDVNNAADQKIQHAGFNSLTEVEKGTSAEQDSLTLNIKCEKTNQEDANFRIQPKKSVEHLTSVTGSESEALLKCHQTTMEDDLRSDDTRLVKEDNFYKCDICDRPFKRLSSLKCHMSYHSEEYMYECNLCPERFKLLRELQEHSLSHKKELLYKCKICSRQFKNHCYLKQHSVIHSSGQLLEKSHKKQQRYKCEICSRLFKNSYYLKQHSAIHFCEKLYDKSCKCKTCGKLFLNNDALNAHTHIHKNAQLPKCKICGKMFRLKYYLMIHQRTHDSVPKKSLVLHNSCLKLNPNRSIKSKICKRTFPSVNTLKVHTSFQAKNQPQECILCGKILASISTLRTHIRIHTGERLYECHICNKKFMCSSPLKEHLRIHTGERPYQCNMCEKSFMCASTFKYHVGTHKDSTFKCAECSKKFKTKIKLQKHVEEIHKHSYECLLCGESYANLSGLHKHVCQALRKCAVCGVSCKSLKILKSHILVHTDEEYYN